ncbi:hypothetical protein JDV02_007179 [Purpureocillium takamizusanense]|uniref:Uncharacterized protein n=1 Tax=Purpureocillium takamizusanense TaxID=2060973 RepID=A0A9Q8QKA0_9HYPO|nr:uncharacterized protein JDV02_007179 [Purpureocillium takamizusanense]UNI21165.1 hypothetical protein JDV02_007179 [Purpureocillium takamizusanense]
MSAYFLTGLVISSGFRFDHAVEMPLIDVMAWAKDRGRDPAQQKQQPQPQRPSSSSERPENPRDGPSRLDGLLSPSRKKNKPPQRVSDADTRAGSSTNAKARKDNARVAAASSSSTPKLRLGDGNNDPFHPVPPIPAVPSCPPYPHWTPPGQCRLRFIRHAFSLPANAPFEAVEGFLARNPSVLRHLAAQTVAHPDWTFKDDGGRGGGNTHNRGGSRGGGGSGKRAGGANESRGGPPRTSRCEGEVQVRDADALHRNAVLYQAIAEVRWGSDAVRDVLAWLEHRGEVGGEGSAEDEYLMCEGLRKRRREKRHVVRCGSVLDHDDGYVLFNESDRRELAQVMRRLRPESLPRKSAHPEDMAGEDDGDVDMMG